MVHSRYCIDVCPMIYIPPSRRCSRLSMAIHWTTRREEAECMHLMQLPNCLQFFTCVKKFSTIWTVINNAIWFRYIEEIYKILFSVCSSPCLVRRCIVLWFWVVGRQLNEAKTEQIYEDCWAIVAKWSGYVIGLLPIHGEVFGVIVQYLFFRKIGFAF